MSIVNPSIIFFTLIISSCGQKKPINAGRHFNQTNQINKEHFNAVLDTIWRTEQEPIRLRDSLGKVFGYESVQFQKQNEIYHRNHDINEKKILEILDTHGWPDKQLIGEEGHLTICNVIQQSSIEIRKKYLPMMRNAVKEKELAPRLLARAEDRLATDRGELQIYGGQIKYYPETKRFNVWPIKDPEHVDRRRAEIGLEPMADFLKNLRNPLEWDLQEQIRRTNEFASEEMKN